MQSLSSSRSGIGLAAGFAFIGIFAALPAQAKPQRDSRAIASAREPEESALFALGVKELNAYATSAFKNGFPQRAREIWFEVLGEYDDDDDVARKALGYFRQGSVWQIDLAFEYPASDEPNERAAKSLTKRFAQLSKKLGAGHRVLAEKLKAAAKAERADYHFRRALRFLPSDAATIASAGLPSYEGLTGSSVELEILKRSRIMDRAIAELLEEESETTDLEPRLPEMRKLDIPYTGHKSRRYKVYGNWEPEVMRRAAVWADRALAFCDVAFKDRIHPGARSKGRRTMVFLRNRATWVRLIETNVSTVGREHAQFIVDNASSAMVGEVHTAGVEDIATVNDLAVRWVVEDYCAFRSDAMEEGIGHAVVAMFFGRNLVFSVGQKKEQGTVASRTEAKLLLPDLDTWRELATEIAWSRTSTTAARLPLLEAASFPTDGRIKAWSFCDYLLRRDPRLLKHLDGTSKKASSEREVAGLFFESAKQPLAGLEEGWRLFWTEDSAIKRAILDRSTPLEAASRDAPKWLEAFNVARVKNGGKAVGWSAQLSVDCKQHVDYLVANRGQRGPAAVHTQLAGKKGYSNSGRSFAQTAVVWTKKDPKKAMALWMLIPGYRDAILNRNIDTAGIYAARGIVVLDCKRGRKPANVSIAITYPAADQTNGRKHAPVPAEVDVSLLGPELKRLLVANDRKKQKQIGLPLSLHLYFAKTNDVTCEVTIGGAPVEGWLVRGNGTIGRTSAPGMWLFYPAEPLPKGVDITAKWGWVGGSHKVTFVAE